MKKSILNGTPVPYELPVDALEGMMSAPDMKTFSLACEALSYKDDPAAFRVMEAHLDDRDKYRRLYVLKTIFRRPEAAALTDRLEAAITSDDPLFVSAGLTVISDFRIRVSGGLLSAVIYNPAGAEHLYIYDEGDEYEPFTLCFSYQHVHVTDADDASAWIDDILNERALAVEFFRGQERLFGGQIDRSDLSRLSYEFLTQTFGGELPGCPGAADSIRVRGWTGRHDLDGRIIPEYGRRTLRLVPTRQS